jgi:O-antigen/teichoic acid export membrane protein
MQESSNRRIAVNTFILYIRMFITTVIGLFTTRYILQSLGASDYGLYNVLGGILAMLNMLSCALYTTTRRYINIEMGKTNGNLNRIFNVCLVLHVIFALITFLIAESIGIYYINNYLNIVPDKLPDAYFVFNISTFVSMLGLINVPYQGLLNAYERFSQIAFIEVIAAILKIPLIICLVHYQGNALRFYAVGICLISFVTFIYYQLISYYHYHDIVKFKFYRNSSLYKDILVFNNYTALGAFAWMAQNQGANVLVNYFFGTVVNAAFAIAYNVQNYVQVFVQNASQSFVPQITQNYSSGNMDRCVSLMTKNDRFSALIILALSYPLFFNIQWVLYVWLGDYPKGADLLCQLVLVFMFVSSLGSGTTTLIHSSGQIKWFQVWGTVISVSALPISYILYMMNAPYYIILIVYSCIVIIGRIASYYMLYRILRFNPIPYFICVSKPVFKTLVVLSISGFIISRYSLPLEDFGFNIIRVLVYTVLGLLSCLWFGLESSERSFVYSKLSSLFF